MPRMRSHEPGTPCWVDLCSPDPAGAVAFYGSLFGWRAQPAVGGDTGGYHLFVLDRPYGPHESGDQGGAAAGEDREGKDAAAVAAVLPLPSEGQQPAWTTHVSVTDIDATAKAAESAGGQVLVGPLEVADQGRTVIFADPAGAVIAAWQPGDFAGVGLACEPDTYCWSELVCRDVEGAKEFYGAVFGWQGDTRPFGPASYTHWQVAGRAVAGMVQMNGQWPAEVSPHWMVYFAVDDCDACASQAAELGGTVSVRPTDIPAGRIAVLSDPHGAFFSVRAPTPG